MNPNQIKQLEKLQKIFNTESVLTPEDIAQVVDGIAKVLKSYRDETRTTNSETKEVVSSFIDNVSEEVYRLRDLVKNSSQTSKYETTDAISSLQRSIKSLIQQIEVDTLSELELIRKEIPEKETPDSILLKLSSSKKKLPLSMVEGSESLLNKSQFETAIIEIGGKLTVLEKRNSKGYGELGGGSEGTGSLFLTRLRDVDVTGLTKNADGKYNLGSGGGGGVTAFTQLTDVPNSYVAQANKGVRVNAAATGLEFFTLGGGTGTVTSVSVVTANGLSGSVATATTTPAITLDISALDASKIANGLVSNAEFQFLDGVTSSIQTQLNAKQATGNYITGLTGDVTASGPGSVAATLATVNASVGSFTNANITVDAKGRITTATNGTGGGGGSGEATIFTVNQTAHGLAVGDIVRSNGTAGQFTKAQADSAANAEVVGIVTVVTDANNYTVTTGGYITTGVPVQAASTVMFLSATTAGLLTATEPSTVGQVSLPLLVVITSGTKAYFNVKRGLVIATAGSGTVGPGTANEIAYFNTTTSIASLATATYPSLTELSYGKGVTSGIQTQLNGKQGTITLTTTGTSGASTLVGNTLNIPQYSGGGSMAIGGSITSATTGSVLFAGASGILQQDNANFFWDDTNNRLGINTATPFCPIHVKGTSYSNLQLLAGSFGLQSVADDNGFVTINCYYDGGLRRIAAGGGGYIQFAGGDMYFAHFTYGSAGSSASSLYSIVATSAGYVGIGTGSIAAMLHVKCTRTDLPVFIAQGSQFQTGDLTHWKNDAGSVLSKVKVDGNIEVPDQAYSSAWDASLEVPTKNAIYDKVKTNVGTIFNSFTDASTTNTNGTEDDLYTYTIAANTLAINGDSIFQKEHVQFVSSATAARRLKKYFAGTLIFDSGMVTLTLGGEFVIETTIIRESATVVRCSVNVVTTSASSVPYATYTRITALTLTGTNILKTTGIASGTGAASGDIVERLSKVKLEPAA